MANPAARFSVTATTKALGRIKLYGFGEHEKIVNEGDMLIVSETGVREANNHQDIVFELLIRGSDMFALLEKVQTAFDLYQENKDYLSQPVTMLGNAISHNRPQYAAYLLNQARESHG